MQTKKIEMKNYVVYAVLVVLTMLITFYLGKWYRTTVSYRVKESTLVSVLSEVKYNELENFLIANPNTLIYISNGTESKEYEEILKKIIIEYELRNDIIILKFDQESEFKQFKKVYLKEETNLERTNLVVFENGTAVSVFNNGSIKLNEENTLDFLKKHEVIVK